MDISKSKTYRNIVKMLSDHIFNKLFFHTSSQKEINILFIENNVRDIELITNLLKEIGNYKFNIITANNLSKGLVVLTENKIDVTLLDLSLSDCIGHDTFRKLRLRTPMLPIVVLTKSKLHQRELKSNLEGAQNYLVKSKIDSESLVKAITEAIEKQKVHKKLMAQLEANLNCK